MWIEIPLPVGDYKVVIVTLFTGVWIEIVFVPWLDDMNKVTLFTGVWIEIPNVTV